MKTSSLCVIEPLPGEHWAPVSSVRFGRKQTVISGCEDGLMNVWKCCDDLNTGILTEYTGSLVTGDKRVTSLSTSSDSDLVVSGTQDSIVKLWDLQVFKEVGQCGELHTSEAVKGLDMNGDGSFICWGSGSQLVTWDSRTSAKQMNWIGDHVTTSAMTSDGLSIVTGTKSGKVSVWDQRAQKNRGLCVTEFDVPVSSLRFNHNDKVLGCGSSDGDVELIDMLNHGCLRQSNVSSEVTCLIFSASDMLLFAGSLGTVTTIETLQVFKAVTVKDLQNNWKEQRIWDLIFFEDLDVLWLVSVFKSDKVLIQGLDMNSSRVKTIVTKSSSVDVTSMKPLIKTTTACGLKSSSADTRKATISSLYNKAAATKNYEVGEFNMIKSFLYKEDSVHETSLDYFTFASSSKEKESIFSKSPEEGSFDTYCSREESSEVKPSIDSEASATKTSVNNSHVDVTSSDTKDLYWDGGSVELKAGLAFKSRTEVKSFLKMYEERNKVKFSNLSGGIKEESLSKQVSVFYYRQSLASIASQSQALAGGFTKFILASRPPISLS